MTAWTDLVASVSAAAAVVLPVGGFVVKRVIAAQIAPVKNQLDLHTQSDTLIFQSIEGKLKDLKDGQNLLLEKLL